MKPFVCGLLCCWLSFSVGAQPSSLSVATDKTTSLIFPFPVLHVDRGSKNVLVQQVAELDYILLVKAATANFPETNLSVVTSDGSVYSFLVHYSPKPDSLTYQVPPQHHKPVRGYANSLLDNPPALHGASVRAGPVKLSLAGLYVKEGVLYLQLLLRNKSAMTYHIDDLRFYLRDHNRGTRTAVQERELPPIFKTITPDVKFRAPTVVVVALRQFTIPDDQYLAIEVGEKNGYRKLQLKVNSKKIGKAIPLPDSGY